jgi:hypothetical protein
VRSVLLVCPADHAGRGSGLVSVGTGLVILDRLPCLLAEMVRHPSMDAIEVFQRGGTLEPLLLGGIGEAERRGLLVRWHGEPCTKCLVCVNALILRTDHGKDVLTIRWWHFNLTSSFAATDATNWNHRGREVPDFRPAKSMAVLSAGLLFARSVNRGSRPGRAFSALNSRDKWPCQARDRQGKCHEAARVRRAYLVGAVPAGRVCLRTEAETVRQQTPWEGINRFLIRPKRPAPLLQRIPDSLSGQTRPTRSYTGKTKALKGGKGGEGEARRGEMRSDHCAQGKRAKHRDE